MLLLLFHLSTSLDIVIHLFSPFDPFNHFVSVVSWIIGVHHFYISMVQKLVICCWNGSVRVNNWHQRQHSSPLHIYKWNVHLDSDSSRYLSVFFRWYNISLKSIKWMRCCEVNFQLSDKSTMPLHYIPSVSDDQKSFKNQHKTVIEISYEVEFNRWFGMLSSPMRRFRPTLIFFQFRRFEWASEWVSECLYAIQNDVCTMYMRYNGTLSCEWTVNI